MKYGPHGTDANFVLGLGEVLWDMLPDGKRCGGAPANVIYHLTKSGIPSAVVSSVGHDGPGDELLDFLRSKEISTEFITRNDLPTGTVEVTLNDGIPAYDIHMPSAWDAISIPDSLKEKLSQVSAVIWGTLAQRCAVSAKAILDILGSVPDNCLKCFDINLRQHYYDAAMIDRSLQFADVLKINEEEVSVTAELLHIAGSQKNVIEQLYRRYSLQYVICTLGADGSMLFDGKTFSSYPVKPCNVIDTVGCGDAFLSAWVCAVLNGRSAENGMIAGTELSAKIAAQAGAMF